MRDYGTRLTFWMIFLLFSLAVVAHSVWRLLQ